MTRVPWHGRLRWFLYQKTGAIFFLTFDLRNYFPFTLFRDETDPAKMTFKEFMEYNEMD